MDASGHLDDIARLCLYKLLLEGFCETELGSRRTNFALIAAGE
jgi:hypothetical protein